MASRQAQQDRSGNASPLRLDLDGAALAANWRWLAARNPGVACGAAIKADGYGLGAREVLARLAAAGCRDFFVSTWAEAEALGDWPGGVAVSVLHGVREADMDVAGASRARPVLNSTEQVARWRQTGRPCDVMVDTGMNRLGLTPGEATSGLLDDVPVETVHSHLACADDPSHPLNRRQRDAFGALSTELTFNCSLANSAGIMLDKRYAFDLVRPGIALYGGRPAKGMDAIRTVVRPTAEVIQVRDVAAGDTVGYGAAFAAAAPMRVAILNLGYADGYFRAFVGSGAALAGDRRLPLVGRVSMDLIAVDATHADIREGDWLAIEHDLPAAAAATGLSQYELLTGLGHRYQRRWT